MSNLEQQLEEFGAAALRVADERNEYKRRADAAEARVKVLEEALRQVANARMPGAARRIALAALKGSGNG